MQCPHCQSNQRDTARFCNNCGKSLFGDGPPASASDVGAPPTHPLLEALPSAAPPAGMAEAEPPAAARHPGKAAITAPMFPPKGAKAEGHDNGSEPLHSAPVDDEDDPFEDLASKEPTVPPPAGIHTAPAASAGPPGASISPPPAAEATPPPAAAINHLPERDDHITGGPHPMEGTPPTPGEQYADDEAPTARVPRMGSEIAVTEEVIEMLGDYEALRPGMLLKGRYHIEEVLHASKEENLYRITDRRGYLQCWNCKTIYPETREYDQYCSNCGADMLSKQYRLREHVHIGEATQPDLASPAALEAARQDEGQHHAPDLSASAPNNGLPAPFAEGNAPDDKNEAIEPPLSVPPPPPPPDPLATQAEPPVLAAMQGEQLDLPTTPMKALDSFIVGSRHYHVEAVEDEVPGFPLGVTLVAGARSDVGKTRQGSPNEDSILVLEMSRIHESATQPFGLYIVADGLGGHDDGQAASRKAVGVIADIITRSLLLPAIQAGKFPPSEEIGEKLKAAIKGANLALVESNDQSRSDMGSTVTGALVVGETAYIINVGDSRTYIYDTVALRPVSMDHSLVMQLVLGNIIQRDDIYTHPQRNQILRSLGDRRELVVDLFTEQLRPGYQLVICCDGLWEMIRDPQIEQILKENSDPQQAADKLMETANENGGEDNISVIVVQARK